MAVAYDDNMPGQTSPVAQIRQPFEVTQVYPLVMKEELTRLIQQALASLVAQGLLPADIAPQVQIYFISGPLVIILGVYGFSLLLPDFLTAFASQYGSWLQRG